MFFYGCDKCFRTSREDFLNEIKKMFGPTLDEVIERFILLHNEELCDFFRSFCIVGGGVAHSV
jgi:hypothetical protein